MSTKIYGASDDLVEFEGTICAEIGYYGSDEDDDLGLLVACDDGTVMLWKYGKRGLGIWQCVVLREGAAFERLVVCNDENATIYSDVVELNDTATRAWQGAHAQQVI